MITASDLINKALADAAIKALEEAALIAENYDRKAFPGLEGVVNTTKNDIAHRIRKLAKELNK